MSASERLAALDAAITTVDADTPKSTLVVLRDALPEIVAVVEQAHRFDWDSHMRHALAALDAKLAEK